MGWFRDLINKIKGTNMLQEGNEEISSQSSNVQIPNSLDSYKFDTTKLNGKSLKDSQLEACILQASKGFNVYELTEEFSELDYFDKTSAYNLGIALSNGNIPENKLSQVGGTLNLAKRMSEQAHQNGNGNPYGYPDDYKFMYVPNAVSMTEHIINEQKLQKQAAEEVAKKAEFRKQFSLPESIERTSTLNQLFNSAIESIGPYGNNITSEDLLQYAIKRGGVNITVGGENPYVEQVDLEAALSLARFQLNGHINRNQIDYVGGPAKVINEMSTNAKISATQYGYMQNQAKNFIDSPIDTIKEMPKYEDPRYIGWGKA